MSKKLTQISPSHHSYVPDQMLTDVQLNEVNEYFEDQIRLTRICLSGVGLACGFEVSNNSGNSITITNGAGVTTDGDLMHLLIPDTEGKYHIDIDSIQFDYYNTFDDSNANYFENFWKDVAPTPKMYELFPAHLSTGKTKLADFDGEGGLSSMVVVLYLECYTNDPGACTTVSCENQGAEEVQRVRVLLLHKDHVAYLLENDTLFNANNVLSDYLLVNEISVPRVILDDANTDDLEILAGDYNSAITSGTMIDNLNAGFEIMLKKTELYDEYGEITELISEQFSIGSLSNTLFQYRYDLLKDLVDSYNELKELFLEHFGTCCPDIHAFPKHLLLGKVNGATLAEEENPHRHIFYKSPILDQNYDQNGRFKSIVDRCYQMLKRYIGSEQAFNEVKITPSNLYVDLGKRAIPFYYADGQELVMNWDFEKSKYGRYNSILGYRQSMTSSHPVVKDPFNYTIDRYNKFRIEGIQGLQYAEALSEVLRLKETHSLPFDIKVLGIRVNEAEEIDITEYMCDFKDLSVLMTAWTAEQVCILGEVSYLLSGFSTIEEGDNIRKDIVLQFKESRDFENTKGYSEYDLKDGFRAKAAGAAYSAEAANAEGVKSNAYDGKTGAQVEVQFSEKQSTVKENMTYAENSLGKIIIDAIDKYSGNESSGLIAYIKDELTFVDFSTWSPTVVDGTIDLPSKILAACYILETLLPDSISSLTSSTLESYTAEIDKLCSYTKQIQAKYKEYVYAEYTGETKIEAQTSTVIDEKILGMMDLLNNQLTNICCGAKKIQTILQEVEDRKAMILDRLKFSNFALQHPGMEHIAGVEPGGTFVMVYSLNSATAENPIPKGTVIADFALPYLCCSDCAPINFIVPKTPVSLSLPTDIYCLSGEDTPLEFNVSPIDGIIGIEDNVEIPGVTINGTTLEIDSSLFPAEQIGVPIRFTVNDQYTECFIIARQKPNVDISYTEDPETPLKYNFEPTGDIEGASFIWDFGDGSPTQNTAFASHIYSLPLESGENSVKVTLTVTPASGACPSTAETPILFDEVIVSIDKDEFCISDGPYPFTITPEGANPTITGRGVTEDQKYFNPALTAGYDGPFDMTYNDNVFATITVNDAPDVAFNVELGETDFSVSSENDLSTVNSYVWKFVSKSTEEILLEITDDEKPVLEYSTFEGHPSIVVILEVANDCGTNTATKGVLIPQIGTVSIDPDVFCVDDETKYPFTIEGYSTPPVIKGPGVNEESTHFIPKAAGVGVHTLSINDGEAEITVTVVEVEVPDFNLTLGEEDFTLESKVDLSTFDSYEWQFRSSGELVHKITDNENPTVPYSTFDPGKTISVELIVVQSPCGPKFSEPQYVDIEALEPGTVSLVPLLFCSDDDKDYDFTIEGFPTLPTITGPGVNASSTAFNPAGAGVGEHTLSVNDGEAEIIVTVVDGETPAFDVNIDGDKFKLNSTYDLAKANSYSWKFFTTGGELLHEVTDETTPIVPFSLFNGQDSIIISLEVVVDPCGTLTSAPKPLNIPKVAEEGTFELTPKEFCPEDDTPYPFEITGYTEDPTVTGNGVDAEGKNFIPKDAGPGSHVLKATDKDGNEKTITVLVKQPPKVTIDGTIDSLLSFFSPDIDGSGAVNYYWEFVDASGEIVKLENIPSYENKVDSFRVFENPKNPAGDGMIPIKLVVTSKDCGDFTFYKTFSVDRGSFNGEIVKDGPVIIDLSGLSGLTNMG